MSFPVRGAFVEYGSDFLGPLPNVVVFQFNPEELTRTITIPTPSAAKGADNPRGRKQNQTQSPPTETLSLTAYFSAADDLGDGGAVSVIPRIFGVGPQLAAIEKMVFPNAGFLSGAIGAAVDAIGSAINGPSGNIAAKPTPREKTPKILFIWGPSRVLPVTITSLSITEQQFDALLNPVKAQVQIGLSVPTGPLASDIIGDGALIYSNAVKEVQATANIAKTVELALDIIPF